MTKFEQMYKTLLFNSVKDTEMDFKRILRANINRIKTTKMTHDEKIIDALIDRIWLKFLEDVKDPKIGIHNAIQNAFNFKYR